MNPKLLLLGLVLLTIAGASVLYDNNEKPIPVPPDQEIAETTPLVTETKLCYLREFHGALPAGVDPDIDYLELTLNPTSKDATGIYNWIPSGKDSSRGQLFGKYEPDLATNPDNNLLFKGRYLFIIEGSEEGREMYIKFNSTSASLGQGELIGDGSRVMRYKNPTNLTYEISFPRIDCTTVKPEHTFVPKGNGGES